MMRCAFAIPGDLATPTGGYGYARKIMPHLACEMQVEVCRLPASFPFPSADDITTAFSALSAFDTDNTVILFDGLAMGAMPGSVLERIRTPIVALVHHPLGLEQGLTETQKHALLASEKAALRFAKHILVPSKATAQALTEFFDIDPARITVAEPGIGRHARAVGSPRGEPLHIVSVGAITPRKGFDVLVEALIAVRDCHWRASVAGSLDRSPDTVDRLRHQIERSGLQSRISLMGNLDEPELSALYGSADLFALATHYEGYGMVFTEAMAHGLPIVASGGGAVRDTIPQTAGELCTAGDAVSFAAALRKMLTDDKYRATKAEASWHHAHTLPGWDATAAIIGTVLKSVIT